MLRKVEFAGQSIHIDDYDNACAALLQAQALAKLVAVSSVTLDDPKCVAVAVGVLEDLLMRVKNGLEGTGGL